MHSLHPGSISTDLFRHVEGNRDGSSNAAARGKDMLRSFVDWAFLLTADDGAKTQLYVATMPEAQIGDATVAKHWRPIAMETFALPPAGSEKLQDELWDFSEAILADFETKAAPPTKQSLHHGASNVLQ